MDLSGAVRSLKTIVRFAVDKSGLVEAKTALTGITTEVGRVTGAVEKATSEMSRRFAVDKSGLVEAKAALTGITTEVGRVTGAVEKATSEMSRRFKESGKAGESLAQFETRYQKAIDRTKNLSISNTREAATETAAIAAKSGASITKTAQSSQAAITKSAQAGVSSLGRLFNVVAVFFAARHVIHAANEYTRAFGLIKSAAENAQGTMDRVFASSQRSGLDFAEQAGLVGSLLQSRQNTGLGDSGTADIAATFSKAVATTSGGAAQDRKATQRFSQIAGSDKVAAADLKAMMRSSAGLAKHLTTASGMSQEMMISLAGKGSLSPKQIIGWLQDSVQDINRDFEKTPKTFAHSWILVKNAYTNFVGKLTQANSLSNTLFRATRFAVDYFKQIAYTMGLILLAWKAVVWQERQAAFWNARNLDGVIKYLAAMRRNIFAVAKMAALFAGLYLIIEDIGLWLSGSSKTVMHQMFGDPKPVIDALKSIGESIKNVMAFFGAGGDDIKKWGAITLVIYALAKAFGMVITVGGKLIAVFKVLRIAAMGALAPLLANPIVWVIIAIVAAVAALAAGIYWVWKNWDLVKKKVSEVWNFIRDFFSKPIDAKAIVDGIIRACENLVLIVLGLWAEVWPALSEGFGRAWAGAVDKVTATWASVKDGALSAWDYISGIFSDLPEAQTLFDGVMAAARLMLRNLHAIACEVWSRIQPGFEAAKAGIKNAFASAIDAVVQFFAALPGRILNAISGLGSSLAAEAGGWVKSLNPFAATTGQTAAAAMGAQAGKAVAQTYIDQRNVSVSGAKNPGQTAERLTRQPPSYAPAVELGGAH